MKRIAYSPSRRIVGVLILTIFLFVAVFVKLFYVQIIQGSALQAKALDQWTRDLPLTAERGRILDNNGVVLADSSTRYTVYVRPNAVTDAEAVASLLANNLPVDYSKILQKIQKKGVSELTVAKKVEKTTMLNIRSSGLDGIYFSADIYRYYPYGDFMTQLLGFTNSDTAGQSGLEAYYEKYLAGTNGYILTETDLIGRELDSGSTYYIPSVAGMDLYTTLDFQIQSVVENVVDSAYAATQAKRVSCLVMNPTDGSILAMAESPSYDLNNVPRDDLSTLFECSKNTMVSNVFEPGSTFKILTAAITLEENIFSEDKTFYCAGSKMVDGQKIKCWKTKGHGSQTFAEGVKNSCNCVFMECALEIGTERFYDYLEEFGLKAKTGIDITGETSGLFLPEDTVKNVDLARIGFGQAVAVTPIGLASAVASCINGGYKVEPHILDRVMSSEGKLVYSYQKTTEKSAISAETSQKLRNLLQSVVEDGSGKAAYLKGYTIGGKTGTAQKYSGAAIAQGKYISSFVGYSFIEGAEAMVVFIVDEPVGGYYGSIVAAPNVGKIFQGIFDIRNIEPVYSERDINVVGVPFILPDLSGMSLAEAKNTLYKLGLYCEIEGDGNQVSAQLPAAGATVDKTNIILLYAP